MDGQTQNQTPNSSGGTPKFVVPVAVAALLVLAVVGYYMYNSSSESGTMTPSSKMEASSAPAGAAMQGQSSYKDGTYTMKGNYVSPGGPREVGITLTLADGVITDASAEVLAEDATSKRFQTEFAEGFKPMVVGKSIDEVSLTKVSGSSLTPKGFNDAVAKIKVEAGS